MATAKSTKLKNLTGEIDSLRASIGAMQRSLSSVGQPGAVMTSAQLNGKIGQMEDELAGKLKEVQTLTGF